MTKGLATRDYIVVKKDGVTIGHLPRDISRPCSLLLRRSSTCKGWTCTETETETSLIVRGKNVRAFNFRRSQPRGRSPPWNIVEAFGEIWNVKYETWNFIRIFPFTISVHLLYIYAYWFSVYLSSLTSSIFSFPRFRWTFKVKKYHESVKRARFLWN